MALAAKLSSFYSEFHQSAPKEVSEVIIASTKSFKDIYDASNAIQLGSKFPSFELSDATGKTVSLGDLLAEGAVLISFYRGEWCPFCNLELRALQKHLADFKKKGVNLVAISPELPDQSLSTTEKLSLEFTVLSDVNNKLAKELGILFPQPDTMRVVYDKFSVDWNKRYGNDKLEIPVPATFLVDSTGVLRNAFIDASYEKRLEPSTALQWIDCL